MMAWLLWLFLHIAYLAGFRNRLVVLVQWGWEYLTWQRGVRLIHGSTTRRP
jgi:NADH:ubiquinone reductase (H+-translocating)